MRMTHTFHLKQYKYSLVTISFSKRIGPSWNFLTGIWTAVSQHLHTGKASSWESVRAMVSGIQSEVKSGINLGTHGHQSGKFKALLALMLIIICQVSNCRRGSSFFFLTLSFTYFSFLVVTTKL